MLLPRRSFCFLVLSFLGIGLACCSGCSDHGSRPGDARLVVFAVVEPQAFLIERIGGSRIRVEVLVPAGKDPHQYEATPNKMVSLSRSQAIFHTGMAFEDSVLPKIKALNNEIRFIDLRVGIVLRLLDLHSHAADSASTGHEHHEGCSHDGLDPHIWFAPDLLKKQAATILETLLELDPVGSEEFRRNYETLIAEIETTRTNLEKQLQPIKDSTIYVFHPSYGYFCDEFSLNQRAIEFEGKSPKTQQLAALAHATKAKIETTNRPPLIFVQPEFNRAPAEALAEAIGAKIVEHSSLERNVLQSMQKLADELTRNDAPQ